MFSSGHDRLSDLISRSRDSGGPETITFYVDGLAWRLHCEWNGGVPFLGFTHPDGDVSSCSSEAALYFLESSSSLSVVGGS